MDTANDNINVFHVGEGKLKPYKEKGEIKASSKGKVISQKEYDEAVVKKMEEFREMNQGRGASGTGMQIRFGG